MSGNRLKGSCIIIILILLSVLIDVGGVGFCHANQLSVDDINQAIQTLGARWIAKENPVSNLSEAARKKMLGGLENGDMGGAEILARSPVNLPVAFDWQNNGGNYVTTVRDQGQCGSCWAFAPTAALESKVLITSNTPGALLDLSEQIVLSCSGGGDCTGGYASTASSFLVNTGVTTEGCYPYTENNGNCFNACPNWQENTYTFDNWYYVVQNAYAGVEDVKSAIYSKGPVVAWFRVYDDFYYYDSGVYSYTTGGYNGNHFVLVTGWSDVDQAFICKNSWDTSWGESGFFKIAYSQLTSATIQFGYWTYAYGDAHGPDSDWDSVYSNLFFDNLSDLDLLRQYRDGFLTHTKKGKWYADLLYRSSEQALQAMLEKPDLVSMANRIIKENRDAVEMVRDGEVGVIYNTDEIITFLDLLSSNSHPRMALLCRMIKRELIQKKESGKLFLGFDLQ